MFDDLNLSEREADGDALILDLFHQLQAALKDANDTGRGIAFGPEEKLFEQKMEVVREIEDRLAQAPASGAAGLAIKGVLAAYDERDPDGGVYSFLLGIVKDATRFAPALMPLIEPMLAASTRLADEEPDAHGELVHRVRLEELIRRADALAAKYRGPLPPGDAGLIEAERRVHELRTGRRALFAEFDWDIEEEEQIIIPIVYACEDELWRFISETSPDGLAGVAIKLRSARENEGDECIGEELGQCIDAIEREIAARGGDAA